MGAQEKIKEIEDEISKTQKNKATEFHLGLLKGKLARLRSQLLLQQSGGSGGGGKGEGFQTKKSGDATIAMVGFPSVGKSTLLNKVTKTESATGAYEYTTMSCIPGTIEYNGARLQLLDLPGIIEGASEGHGRGKQVIAAARNAELILMLIDSGKADAHKRLLQRELESVGIRLNQQPPDISFKKKSSGGVRFTSTGKLSYINEKMVKGILHDYRIHNAEIVCRCDPTVDEFIDVIEGNRQYIKCLYVYNKIDMVTMEEVDRIAREPNSVVVSCEWDLNLDVLLEEIWDTIDVIRVYTKSKGAPDFSDPVVLPRGVTVGDICDRIHRDMRKNFKHALVWGTSAKHTPQHVGINHVLNDEDVLQISHTAN
eukprot:gb/GECH01007466.1/.p1 GENE.gb/GECH01007466.1/~~gb/GECH01007466.1/.p1  ORF type:complete len:369 (+),score=88.03 gb/GECH01007466.1/:1-1107(+)